LNGYPIEFSDEAVILAEMKISEGIMSGTFDQQPFMIVVLNLEKNFSPPMPGTFGSWLQQHRAGKCLAETNAALTDCPWRQFNRIGF